MAETSVISSETPQQLVRLALLDFLPGAVVSTRQAIMQVRELNAACPASDGQLVDLIVATATGQSMTIEFDHTTEYSI